MQSMIRPSIIPQLVSIALGLFLAFFSANLFAQSSTNSFVSLQSIYQKWTNENDNNVSQFSIPVFAVIPVNENFSVNLRGTQANTSSSVFEDLNGFTDSQAELNYFLPDYNLVFNLGVSLPTGKTELSLEEFLISGQLSLDFYNFQASNFGQGLGFAPGVSWAYQVNSNLVLGLGAAYQVNGAYKPLEGMAVEYDPGDEFLMTVGADYLINTTTSIAADFLFNTYGEDKLGNLSFFQPGNKIVTSLLFQKFIGFDELSISGRYRSRGQSRLATLTAETPDNFAGKVLYKRRISSSVILGILGEARFYEEATNNGNSVQEYGFGLAPRYALNDKTTVPVLFQYFLGNISGGQSFDGFDLRVGLNYSF